MANFLYVDNSNVWIEGMHVAAVASGLATTTWSAQEHKICDYARKLDFSKLLQFVGGSCQHRPRSSQWLPSAPERLTLGSHGAQRL